MRLREIPCPAFGDGYPAYVPGDCWFARPTTEAEREEARTRRREQLQQVAQYRWAWWADRDRLFDDSDIAAEHRDRRPLVIVLPSGGIFVSTSPMRAGSTTREWHRQMDAWVEAEAGRTWDAAYDAVPCPAFERGWSISGEGIALTLSPSIHYNPGGSREWHGWLTNGELA